MRHIRIGLDIGSTTLKVIAIDEGVVVHDGMDGYYKYEMQ